MRQTSTQSKADFMKRQAMYRTAWRHFSAQVSRWHFLQAEKQGGTISIRKAEAAVQEAQEQYWQARNALTEYMLEYSSCESLLVGSR